VEVGLSGEIRLAISRPYFVLSLTDVSHAVWYGAPLGMNGGTKDEGLEYKRPRRLKCDSPTHRRRRRRRRRRKKKKEEKKKKKEEKKIRRRKKQEKEEEL
jgi:hypothetical protein